MRVRTRRKRSPLARLRAFWLPIALSSLALVAVLVLAATWPGFIAKHVTVSGNHEVSRSEILARAAVRPHISIWLQNTRAMVARIDAIPYIATARIVRVPPATIRIDVTERAPFALLRSGGNEALVDRSLRVLEPATGAEPYPVLAIEPEVEFEPGEFVRTHDATELRDALMVIAARQMEPVELELDRFGGLTVTMRGGIRLLLGEDQDLAQKLTLAAAIRSQVVVRRRRVAAIDLRAPATPVLVYR
ncbi:MAG: FtsQ-type POTRA domain-containing protein [Candidatus Eremiobacteraeota bacterium]|nr:FtsQ-type POTRA domain-containing protein [Candidatus Eremiobacteraeota bacterium]